MKTNSYTYCVLRYVHDVTSGDFVNVGVVLYELDPEVRTPRTGKSVVHGRPVRSLATNQEPAGGGQRGGAHCDGASVMFLPSARQRRSNCAGGTYPNDECLRSVL